MLDDRYCRYGCYLIKNKITIITTITTKRYIKGIRRNYDRKF